MSILVNRFDIFLVSITSPAGTEIRIPQPCVVVSPDELNNSLNTIIVAPIRIGGRSAPFRVPFEINCKQSQIALEQIRTINKDRLIDKMGKVSKSQEKAICSILGDMFVF